MKNRGLGVVIVMLSFLSLTLFRCATITSTSNSLMPKDRHIVTSAWESYGEIEAVFNSILPGKTIEDLKKIGLNPKGRNVTTLDPLTIRKLFLGDANSGLRMEDLPMAVQEYLRDFENCRGYEYNYESVVSEGKGSLLWRLLGVKKEYLVTGWRFKGYIFVRKDVVVCVIPSGTPNINQIQSNRDIITPIGSILIGTPSKFLLR